MIHLYADLAYADVYNKAMGRSEKWAPLSDSTKRSALALATLVINTGRYTGGAVAGQENAFPRLINKGVVPEEVRQACCEEAYARACDEETQKMRARMREGVTSVSIGNVSKGFADPLKEREALGMLWSDTAEMLLARWHLGTAEVVV